MAAKKEPQWDVDFEPLVKYMLKSDIKTRNAVEVFKKAVVYVRGSDLVRWVLKHDETLRTNFPQCFDNPEVPITRQDAESLGQSLVMLGFLYRAEHKPLRSTKSDAESVSDPTPVGGAGTKDTEPAGTAAKTGTFKWPRRLETSSDQTFVNSDNVFLVIAYELKSMRQLLYLTAIILSIFVACLFPAWPLAMKLLTWYLLVGLCSFMLVATVLRLVVFFVVWFFGCDLWIFPNLFDDDLGVIDSFIPAFSFVYRRDNWLMLIARLFLAVVSSGAVYQLLQTHSVSDIGSFAGQQFLDLVDWGHQKLAAPPRDDDEALFGRFKRPAAIGDDIYDGFRCLAKCGFESFEALEEDCLKYCPCMEELVTSKCYTLCTDVAKEKLMKDKEEICSKKPAEEEGDSASP